MKRHGEQILFDVGVLTLVAVLALLFGLFMGSRIVPKAYVYQTPVTPATAAPAVTADVQP